MVLLFHPKPMWAAATLPCRLWTPAATTTGDKGPFTACARNSQPRKNISYDYDDEEDEDKEMNNRELELLKQQEIGDLDPGASASAPNSAKISGSAVLLALQKASAQKTSKKIKKKKEIKNMNEDKDSRRNRDAIVDYSDVKPLCIKSDWKDRLDKLELQLHQLIHDT